METEDTSTNKEQEADTTVHKCRKMPWVWIVLGVAVGFLAGGGAGWMIGQSCRSATRRSASSSSSDSDSRRDELRPVRNREDHAMKTITLPGGVKIEMVYVEPGLFMMGEGEEKHRERIAEGFWLGKYEVTQAQWKAVMGENPSWFTGANLPVECVSWNDCQEFIKKLNALPEVKKSGWRYRLPTEKEWEYACRAGSTGNYCKLADGTEVAERTLGEVAWYTDNSERGTHPVGQKKPNAFGLYDMHGNVWEWCEDLYEAGHSSRVSRGGSWDRDSGDCTAGGRGGNSPDYRSSFLGFRLAAFQDVNR